MPENTPSSLEDLHIASPCHASWDAMKGDDKARFCKTCQKNVFNLSMMSRAEAEALIQAKEGKLCVRYAQREDGTVVTQDCPVGFERARQQALRPFRFAVAGIATVVAALANLLGVSVPAFAQPPINISKGSSSSLTLVKGEPITAPSTVTMMGGPRGVAPTDEKKTAAQCVNQPGQPPMLMGKPSSAAVQNASPVAAPVQPTNPPTQLRVLQGDIAVPEDNRTWVSGRISVSQLTPVNIDDVDASRPRPAPIPLKVTMGKPAPLPAPTKPAKVAPVKSTAKPATKPTAKIKQHASKTKRAAR